VKRFGLIAPALLAALLAGPPAQARADSALRGDFDSRVMASAAALTCAAQVWAPALVAQAPAWRLAAAFDPTDALPKPGAWAEVQVPLALEGTTLTAQALVRVRLLSCVAGWAARGALAPGSPLNLSTLRPALFDPRGLNGPPQSGSLPPGATAARALMQGQALLQADVADPSAVHAGQRVTLMVREGCIVAGDQGVLLDSGVQGSLLRAQHVRSGKIVRGRLDNGTLLVED
jgi:flagella basal body P-ring formation protein FlgA